MNIKTLKISVVYTSVFCLSNVRDAWLDYFAMSVIGGLLFTHLIAYLQIFDDLVSRMNVFGTTASKAMGFLHNADFPSKFFMEYTIFFW